MIALWVYLALGAAVLAFFMIEKRDMAGDAFVVLAGLMITVIGWPVALFMRWYWEHKRLAYNRAAADRRQQSLSANYLKHLPDEWWAGADLKPDARPIVGYRHTTWEEVKMRRNDR